MARSKRPASPERGSRTSNRLRSQKMQEIIVIDDDPTPRRKPTKSKPTTIDTSNDSDIEIVEDPVELESLRKKKGKGKRKASPSAQSSPRKKRSKHVSHLDDASQAQMDADAEMARRMAMEWEASGTPEPNGQPQAGPSTQSSSNASTSYPLKDVIEIPPSPPPRAAARQKEKFSKEVIEVLSSNASRATTTDNARELAGAASGISAHNLDIPYINLPNPELKLQEFKTLLTTSRECSQCGELTDTSSGQTPEQEPNGTTESTLRILLHLECPNDSCPAVHCRGCFKPVSCFSRCKKAKRSSTDTCEVFKCCAEARAIALFEALSSFDKGYLADKASAESRTQEMKKQAKKNAISTVGPGGTGYSTGAHQYVGAGGSGGDDWYEDEDDFEEEFEEMMGDFMEDMEDDLLGNDEVWAQKYKALQTKVEALKKVGTSAGKQKATATALVNFGGHAQVLYGPLNAADLFGSHPKQPPAAPAPVVEELSKTDKALVDALNLLTEILPAPYGAEPAIYDLLPHPCLGALILMSHIPLVLAQLLRNDSVTDWIARSPIYHAMLSLLKRLADCELTIPILVGHRPQFSKHPGLGAWIRGKGEFAWQRNEKGEVEMAVPLLGHFKKLKKQAEAFLRTAQAQFAGGDGDQEVIEGLSLCADIVGAQGDIKKAMAALYQYNAKTPDVEDEERGEEDVQATYGPLSAAPAEVSLGRGKRTRKAAVPRAAALTLTTSKEKGKGKGKEKAAQPTATGIQASLFDIEKEYIAACEKLSFDYVTMGSEVANSSGLVYKTYNFAPQLLQTQNGTRIPKNRIHFAKELAVMATSLPPGIWVRVDEVRNDAIKVMIAGPQGTPYAGGLFEFDCFIPLEYPNLPPKMHLRTTGGGTVRFNPNLYNCGKVCLSLLGTWQGSPDEQWSPSRSTLLQVLVSIQSMILNEAPYYNEPGHGTANLKAPASVDYNRNTSLQTVRWAMVDWFKEEHMNGIWKDVIKSHFSLRKEKIQQQIAVWAKEDPRMKAYHTSLRGHTRPLNPVIYGGALGGHLFGNLRLPPAPAPANVNTMDLVAEFEKGMQRVEAWPSEG